MLADQLLAREAEGRPFRVGVIGAGTFGTQIVAQMGRMRGLRVAAVADLNAERAARALRLGGTSDAEIAAAVTTSADDLVNRELDVVIEATGHAEAGALHADAAIAAGKPVVMVTVEADVLVGHRLRQLAAEAGVLYSMAYGDEPALAAELVDWARTLGFAVVAAGKGTRFTPAFRHATPDDVPRLYGFTGGGDYNLRVFNSFLDGTKHAIEMAALANATGLGVDVRGMHFPTLDLREMPDRLAPVGRGGILGRAGVVEAVSVIHPDGRFVERGLRGGVYAVFDAPTEYVRDSLAGYGEIIGMVHGATSRQAMIYRPQHFVGHEVPIGVARLLVRGETCGGPVHRAAEVVAAAKMRLAPGTELDGEGGYTVYGLLEDAAAARRENLLPIGLTAGAVVTREVPADGLLTWADVEPRESFALALRRAQDARGPA
ncbi:MAG: Gfo/Idh/MocA family oxidoreductase [Gemmataceae bacterium]|nr:Gfo/Idh/MocA family oxidoreductase [Gemmataceae bacterium]